MQLSPEEPEDAFQAYLQEEANRDLMRQARAASHSAPDMVRPLVEHLIRMDWAAMEIPITVDGEDFMVIVRRAVEEDYEDEDSQS